MRPLVVAALTTLLVPDLPPMPIAAWRAIKRLPEGEILEFARLRLPGVDRKLIKDRLDRISEFEEALHKLSEAGIAFVTEFEYDFPQLWVERLGDRVPPYLFVAGNVALLNASAVGVVGSREVDSVGLGFSRQIAEETVKLGHAVISGGAKGVDEIAMQAAVAKGGSAVGVLAESLVRQMKKWNLDSGQICLCTPFAPDLGFQVGNAMARNKLIYAGSLATVVVSSAEGTGGTWSGATEAIKGRLCPVLVRAGGGEGNPAIIKQGGVAIAKAPDLHDLLKSATRVQESLL